MFNKKRLEALAKRIASLESVVEALRDMHYTEDYFGYYPDGGEKKPIIEKDGAKSFEVLTLDCYGHKCVAKKYTTEQSYKDHKPMIDRFKKEVKEYAKKYGKNYGPTGIQFSTTISSTY